VPEDEAVEMKGEWAWKASVASTCCLKRERLGASAAYFVATEPEANKSSR
jgi:hypothetical protein